MMAKEDDPYSYGNERIIPICVLFKDARNVLKMDKLGLEISQIALALTVDPIASLVDTTFIGEIGSVELAAVGVSIALFNQVSRIAIFPLVSVTTSFVAEEDTLGSVSREAEESDSLETDSMTNTEHKQLIPQKDKSKRGSLDIQRVKHAKRHIPSASSAMAIGGVLGLLQYLCLSSNLV